MLWILVKSTDEWERWKNTQRRGTNPDMTIGLLRSLSTSTPACFWFEAYAWSVYVAWFSGSICTPASHHPISPTVYDPGLSQSSGCSLGPIKYIFFPAFFFFYQRLNLSSCASDHSLQPAACLFLIQPFLPAHCSGSSLLCLLPLRASPLSNHLAVIYHLITPSVPSPTKALWGI